MNSEQLKRIKFANPFLLTLVVGIPLSVSLGGCTDPYTAAVENYPDPDALAEEKPDEGPTIHDDFFESLKGTTDEINNLDAQILAQCQEILTQLNQPAVTDLPSALTRLEEINPQLNENTINSLAKNLLRSAQLHESLGQEEFAANNYVLAKSLAQSWLAQHLSLVSDFPFEIAVRHQREKFPLADVYLKANLSLGRLIKNGADLNIFLDNLTPAELATSSESKVAEILNLLPIANDCPDYQSYFDQVINPALDILANEWRAQGISDERVIKQLQDYYLRQIQDLVSIKGTESLVQINFNLDPALFSVENNSDPEFKIGGLSPAEFLLYLTVHSSFDFKFDPMETDLKTMAAFVLPREAIYFSPEAESPLFWGKIDDQGKITVQRDSNGQLIPLYDSNHQVVTTKVASHPVFKEGCIDDIDGQQYIAIVGNHQDVGLALVTGNEIEYEKMSFYQWLAHYDPNTFIILVAKSVFTLNGVDFLPDDFSLPGPVFDQNIGALKEGDWSPFSDPFHIMSGTQIEATFDEHGSVTLSGGEGLEPDKNNAAAVALSIIFLYHNMIATQPSDFQGPIVQDALDRKQPDELRTTIKEQLLGVSADVIRSGYRDQFLRPFFDKFGISLD